MHRHSIWFFLILFIYLGAQGQEKTSARRQTLVACSVTSIPQSPDGKPVIPPPAQFFEVPELPRASTQKFPPSRSSVSLPAVRLGDSLTLTFSSIIVESPTAARDHLPAALRYVKVDVIDARPAAFKPGSLTYKNGLPPNPTPQQIDEHTVEWSDLDTSPTNGFVGASTGYRPVSLSEPFVFTLDNLLSSNRAADDGEVICTEMRRVIFDRIRAAQDAAAASVITENVTVLAPVDRIDINRDQVGTDLRQPRPAVAGRPSASQQVSTAFTKRERVFRVTPTVVDDSKPLFSQANNRYYQWRAQPDAQARERFIESVFGCGVNEGCNTPLTVYLSEDGKLYGQIAPKRDIESLFELAECGKNDLIYISSDATYFDLAKALLFLVSEKYPLSADPDQRLEEMHDLALETLKFARERRSQYRFRRFVEPNQFVQDFADSKTLDANVRRNVQAIVNSSAGGLVGVLDTASIAINNTVNAALYVVVLSWVDLAYYGAEAGAYALYATEIMNYQLSPAVLDLLDYFDKQDEPWGRYLQTQYFPYVGNQDEVFMAKFNEKAITLVLLIRDLPNLVKMVGSAGKNVIQWLKATRVVAGRAFKKLGDLFRAAKEVEESKPIFIETAELLRPTPGGPVIPGHVRVAMFKKPAIDAARDIFQAEYQAYSRLQTSTILNDIKPAANSVNDAFWTPTAQEVSRQLQTFSEDEPFFKNLPTSPELRGEGLAWRGPAGHGVVFQTFSKRRLLGPLGAVQNNAQELGSIQLGAYTVDAAGGFIGTAPEQVSILAKRLSFDVLSEKDLKDFSPILLEEFGFVQKSTQGPIYFGLTGDEASFPNSITAQELLMITNTKALRDRVIFFKLFTKPRPPAPLAIQITSPVADAILVAATTVEVQATSSSPIAEVTLAVDGTQVQRLTASPYRFTIDPARFSPGSHALKATARDTAGGNQSFSLRVNFAKPSAGNIPTVSIDSPSPNSQVQGSVQVTIRASDKVGITEVRFQSDGVDVKVFSQPPYQFIWDVSRLAAGLHPIKAIATNSGGNKVTASTTITLVPPPVAGFAVSNVAPTQASVGQTVTINGSGLNSVPVENLRFTDASGNFVDAASYSVDPGGTRITAVVPATAVNGFGPVRVKLQGQTARQTSNAFRALPSVVTVSFTVADVTPAQASVGQTVTINGSGLNSVPVENLRFTDASGNFVDAASYSVDPGGTRITAVVPATAANGFGPIRVKPQGQTAKLTTNSFNALRR